MSIVVVGASHRSASLDLLERMAVSAEALPKVLHALDGAEDVSEVVVLATCNRTEVYLVAERFHGAYAQVRDAFADLTFLAPEDFSDSLYVHYDDHAVRHLFEVAAGLDSAVPGEHEILGQVRTAWELARAQGTARRTLNLLFRRAIEVGKRARTETRIAHHVTSVSQAAVVLAGERLAPSVEVERRCVGNRAAAGLGGRRALVVGAGTMAKGMAGFLLDAGVQELWIANRTPAAAERLAATLTRHRADGREPSVHAIGLDELDAPLGAVDLLCTATDAPDAILSVERIRAATEHRGAPLLVVDVAVPRDLDPRAAELPGVDVLDMAAVAAMTEANLAARRSEAEAVQRIVDAEQERFAAEASAREVAPIVTALREHAEALRHAELERYAAALNGLDTDQRHAVEALTRSLLAKLLHDPTVALKDAAGSSRGERLAESVRDLFDLD